MSDAKDREKDLARYEQQLPKVKELLMASMRHATEAVQRRDQLKREHDELSTRITKLKAEIAADQSTRPTYASPPPATTYAKGDS